MRAFLKHIASSKRLTKFLTVLGPTRTIVLMYHDLCEDDDFKNWLRVSVSDFDKQLSRLREIGEFIGPDEIFCTDGAKRLRFLITFDDGYRNNFELAAPILKRHGAPGLFFVSTGHVQDQTSFWPDFIVTPIQALSLDQLDLSAFELGVFKFRPMGSVERWDDIDRLLRSLKNLGNIRHATVAAVLDFMKTAYAETLAEHMPRFRPLNAGEVQQMSADPLLHFGSHGHYHDILTYYDRLEVEESLRSSRRALCAMTGTPVQHLSYPNGSCNERIKALALEAGYTRAFTSSLGIIGSHESIMALPRVGVGGVGFWTLPFFQINQLLAKAMVR